VLLNNQRAEKAHQKARQFRTIGLITGTFGYSPNPDLAKSENNQWTQDRDPGARLRIHMALLGKTELADKDLEKAKELDKKRDSLIVMYEPNERGGPPIPPRYQSAFGGFLYAV
jgi:hypothetical protein